MELEQARKRAAELRAVIEKNNRLYYDQDAPELEDYEYDQLTRELKTIEAQFPQLVTPDSPTQHVGGTPSGKFSKVAHAVKMESLQDAFSLDELREFDQRVREAGVTPEYVVEIKIDGLSVSLEYRNGRLTRGSTRGDGLVGEDVTENLATIKSIPKEIPNAPDFLEVRGEVYMPHEAFFALKEQQELEDKTPFKNPRNAAAGSLRQKDAKITAARQREEASQKLSDNRMQKLRTEKDLSLHEAALETLKGRSGEAEARVRELQANVAAAKERIAANELRANEIKRASEENKQKITAAEETIRKANAERMEKEAAVTRLTQENRTLTDERERMSGEMARLAERRTAAENELNDTNTKLWEEYQLTAGEAKELCVEFESLTELRRSVAEVRGKIRGLGNVNVGAIEEYKEVKERYDFLKAQVTDVEKAKSELTRMIAELCSEMEELFTTSFKQINTHFQQIFRELFGGGHARLYLSDEANVLESGIEIEVSPPGKVIKNLSALSGGEQALVAISIYFAILNVNPAPFCFLDEIEAALDDVNVARYAQYLRRMTDHTQFIVITHRRGTMEAADVLYGVTMQEDGVSKILRLDLDNVSADLIT